MGRHDCTVEEFKLPVSIVDGASYNFGMLCPFLAYSSSLIQVPTRLVSQGEGSWEEYNLDDDATWKGGGSHYIALGSKELV